MGTVFVYIDFDEDMDTTAAPVLERFVYKSDGFEKDIGGAYWDTNRKFYLQINYDALPGMAWELAYDGLSVSFRSKRQAFVGAFDEALPA